MANANQNAAPAAGTEEIRQIVNKNTQQNKRKRTILNLILILLFILLLIGIGFLTYFIVYNSVFVPPKEVVLDIEFDTYEVYDAENEKLIDSRSQNFAEGEDSTEKSLDFNHELPGNGGWLRLDYKITNKLGLLYSYTIDFSNLKIGYDNCKIELQIVDGEEVGGKTTVDLVNGNTKGYESNNDITISVYFSVLELQTNTSCEGNISLIISMVDA